MRDKCPILAELKSPEGALQHYTILLLLNDLEVSDIKETLAAGGTGRESQHHWWELGI